MTVLLAKLTRELNSLGKATSSALQNQVNHLTAWDDRLSEQVFGSIFTSINNWLANYPILNWLIYHPGIGLLIILIVVILISRLLITIYRGVAQGIDRLWLAILRSPFWLVKLIFGWEIKSKTNQDSVGTTITNYEISNSSELELIMNRLEQIQQQQQQILQDIALLKQQTGVLEPKQIDLKTIKSLKSSLPFSNLKKPTQ